MRCGRAMGVRCRHVALARKLLIALWRYVNLREVPEGAVLKSV
jgi:hypothetical protein